MFIGDGKWRGEGEREEARTPIEIVGVLLMFLVLLGILVAVSRSL
jgi:hypothetical protein